MLRTVSTEQAKTSGPARRDGGNRQRILQAARGEFASKGFRSATMRSIANGAGVDVALLAHYFGNKERLFAETIELPTNASGLLASALSGPAQGQGDRLTRAYLWLWEDPATAAHMQALARSALSNDAAYLRVRNLLTDVALSSPHLPPDDPRLHLALAQLFGIAVLRHARPMPTLAELDFERLVALAAPAVRATLTGIDDNTEDAQV